MIMSKLGVLVAVSIAAYGIRQLTIRSWNSSALPTNCSENGEDTEKNGLDVDDQKGNSINGAASHVSGSPSDPELRELLPRDSESRLLDCNKKEEYKVPESHMERLLALVMELEERKVKLEDELLMYDGYKDSKSDATELRKELKAKDEDISMLNITISSLQAEKKKLQEEIVKGALMKKELEEARGKIKELQRQLQLHANQTKEHLLSLKRRVSTLQAKEEEAIKKEAQLYRKLKAAKGFELELGELKQKNRQLQHEKEELTSKLDVMEARSTTLTTMTESEIITKEREEARNLRHANEELMKQLEGLQMNRFSEVEELVYLRWVNACLRYELRDNETLGGESARDLNKSSSPKSKEKAKQLMLEYSGLGFGQAETDHESNFSHPTLSSGIEDFDNTSIDSSRRRTSSFRWKDPLEAAMALSTETLTTPSEVKFQVSSRNSVNSVATSFQLMSQSLEESVKQKYSAYKEHHKLTVGRGREKQIKEKAEKERVEKSCYMRENPTTFPSKPAQIKDKTTSSRDKVYQDLELVRFDQKLMKPEVKADMETEGDLVMPLAMEVREASFSNMEDVVSFVSWLDQKLSSLVDERVILEHFNWPEGKSDALREAAFEYQNLIKLGEEVSFFVDSPKLTREVALKTMHSLLDKMEQNVYAILRNRELLISRYEELGIPVDWLLDSGVVGKMKVLCVELARKYMKRIVNEVSTLSGPHKEPNREFLLLQGVRFASRVHQFAGGFDVESMKAFEELRSRIHTEAGQKQ